MKQIIAGLLLMGSLVFGENIRIGGFVVGPDYTPLSGVQVYLKTNGKSTFSDSTGYFMIDDNTALIPNVSNNVARAFGVNKSSVQLRLDAGQNVHVDLISLTGRTISLFRGALSAGVHSIPLLDDHSVAMGVYILRITTGSVQNSVKIIPGVTTIPFTQAVTQTKISAKSVRANEIDTLMVSMPGYRTRTVPLSSYSQLFNSIMLSRLGKLWDPAELENNDLNSYSAGNYYEDWTDITWNNNDYSDSKTAVIFDTVKATEENLCASVRLIRNAGGGKTAAAGSWITYDGMEIPENSTHSLIVSYRVAKPSDTLSLYLTKSFIGIDTESFSIGDSVTINGIVHYYSAFRAVLTNGAKKPGEFVTDTVHLTDFTLKYGQDDQELMDSLGYVVNEDREVYLHENQAAIKGDYFNVLNNLPCVVFESESEGIDGDTIDLDIKEVKHEFRGNFLGDAVDGLIQIENNGWFPIVDQSSSVASSWDNGTATLKIQRGPSDESNNQWAYAGALGMLNSKGSLEHLRSLSVTFEAPAQGDTVALSIERGQRFGAGDEENNRYGSFRVVIPSYDSIEYSYGDTLIPGETYTFDIELNEFTMDWGDDPTARYQMGDTIDVPFLTEANAIGIYSEKDNGTYGAAAKGDSLTFKIHSIRLYGSHGLQREILPLIGQ